MNNPPIVSDDEYIAYQPPPHEGWIRLLVFLIACAVLLPNAGSFGLWDCWETHYGEVARYMHETGDLFSPWWGYKEQIGNEPRTGEWFFSKPVLIMYGEIIFMKLIGLTEWAFRLPWAFLGIFGVFMTYVVLTRCFSRRVGLLAAGALLTSPLYFMLSRQAITDMPFVGTMTLGLLFFINAYYGQRFSPSNRAFIGWFISAVGFFLIIAVPQYVIVALDIEPEGGVGDLGTFMQIWLTFQKTGIYHAIIYFIATFVLLGLILIPMWKEYKQGILFTFERKDFWMRRFSLWTAYVFLGLATLGKGLLGFMLPGAILFIYLLVTQEWRALKRLEILRGTMMMCLTMFPWYLGMLAKHGNGFYARFFVHDHFNRLGAGVHQIDTGTFEHFIKWLSIGTFPWVAFAPLLIWGIARLRIGDSDPKSRAKVFLFIWAFFAYCLFTLSATKFHHYIFPALPPFIMLIGIYLSEFIEDTSWIGKMVALVGIGVMLSVGFVIRSDQQALRNMFTYKYDRPLPDHPPIDPDLPVASGSSKTWKDSTFYEYTNPFIKTLLSMESLEHENFMLGILICASIAFIILIFSMKSLRMIGVGGLWLTGVALAFWALNYYMPMLSPSWSQKYIFDDYYKRCTLVENPPEIDEAYTPLVNKIGLSFISEYFGARGKRVCKEDVVAWLITWRGETFYTYSEIKPLMKANQLGPYLETINKGKPFFALTQAGRSSGIKGSLDRETETLRKKGVPEFQNIKAWDVVRIHEESAYFGLVKATPITMEEAMIKPLPTDERPESPPERTDVPPPGM